jgi:dihydroorotate dehydrogenase (fumarate)
MSVDLSTRYLGFELKNPLVVSACSLGNKLENLKRFEDAGAAAIVLPSLFEEQIEHDELAVHRFYERGSESFAEALSYFPELDDYSTGPESYLRLIEHAKESLEVPIIGSLNGTSLGGWTDYARLIEGAGADALELNVYLISTDPEMTAAEVEDRYLNLVHSVQEAISIPLAVKISPYFSSLPNMVRKLVRAGAAGLVLFNRFLQPDIDLDTLQVSPHLVLSTSVELRVPLRWIAILRPQTDASLAASSGVHTAADMVKLLLAGADVTMTASSLYQHGVTHLSTLLDGLNVWLAEKEYASVTQLKGSLSQVNAPDPDAFERANYIKTLISFGGAEATT